MKKIQLPLFLAALGALLVTGCETTSTSSSRSTDAGRGYARPSSNEFRGAWVYDPRRFDPDEVVHDLRNAGFNAVFVRLSSAGAAYYPSRVLPEAAGTHMDYAQAYADAGHKYGVKVYGWHVCFMMHNAPNGNVKSAIKKGEVMRNAKGQAPRPTYNVPVRTPALASNRALERDAMVELVTRYPLDGVQLDYIRYFSPGVDYSATSRAAFERDLGKPVRKWPSDVVSGSLHEKYHEWRANQVSKTVREVAQAIRAANPRAKISAAVWHSPDIAYNDYAQNWVSWVREGLLDFVVPMDYTPDNGRLEQWINHQKEAVGGRIPVYAGLGSYLLNRPEQLNRQIDIVRRAGLPGYVLYNYDERLKQRFLADIPN